MRQNIAFAVLFSVAGIGLAVAGLITPAIAIIVMTLSIFAVLVNTAMLVGTDLGITADEENAAVEEAEIRTPGMVCEGCAGKITEGLLAMDAVQKVIPDVKGKRVRVLFDPKGTSEDDLRERVKELGYL